MSGRYDEEHSLLNPQWRYLLQKYLSSGHVEPASQESGQKGKRETASRLNLNSVVIL